MSEEKSNLPAMPDYMKKFMQQSQNDAASMAASSISVPRVSIKGKRFKFIDGENEELVKTLTIDIVILGVEPEAGKFIKTFYKNKYNPNDSAPPDCSSSDGIRPDVWVNNPVCSTCAQCPNNVFGSATSEFSGKKTKACKDSKRLWIAKPSDIEKVYGLNVPVTSLKHMSKYGKEIGANGYPLPLVITQLGFEDESEFPQLTFKHVGFVHEDAADTAIKLNTERPWAAQFGGAPLLEDRTGGGRPALPGSDAPMPSEPPQTGGDTSNIDDVVGDWGG